MTTPEHGLFERRKQVDKFEQIALLLAQDIEVIALAATNSPDNALKHLLSLVDRKNKLFTDDAWRQMRYEANGALSAAGIKTPS